MQIHQELISNVSSVTANQMTIAGVILKYISHIVLTHERDGKQWGWFLALFCHFSDFCGGVALTPICI